MAKIIHEGPPKGLYTPENLERFMESYKGAIPTGRGEGNLTWKIKHTDARLLYSTDASTGNVTVRTTGQAEELEKAIQEAAEKFNQEAEEKHTGVEGTVNQE